MIRFKPDLNGVSEFVNVEGVGDSWVGNRQQAYQLDNTGLGSSRISDIYIFILCQNCATSTADPWAAQALGQFVDFGPENGRRFGSKKTR